MTQAEYVAAYRESLGLFTDADFAAARTVEPIYDAEYRCADTIATEPTLAGMRTFGGVAMCNSLRGTPLRVQTAGHYMAGGIRYRV